MEKIYRQGVVVAWQQCLNEALGGWYRMRMGGRTSDCESGPPSEGVAENVRGQDEGGAG